MNESAILHNQIKGTTGFAGGLFNDRGAEAVIKNSFFAYNSARFGAAINNQGQNETASTGIVSLTNTSFTQHIATGSGGSTISNRGEMSMIFCTMAENPGGNQALGSGGKLEIGHCLITDDVNCSSSFGSLGGNLFSKPNNCGNLPAALFPEILSVPVAVSGPTMQGGFTPVMPFRRVEGTSFVYPADTTGGIIQVFTDQRGRGFDRYVDGDGDGKAWPDPGAWEAPKKD